MPSYEEQIMPIVQVADAEVAALKNRNQQLNIDVETEKARADAAERQYEVHMETYHSTTPPEPPIPPTPVVKTLVGSSLGSGDFEQFAARCGGLESTRTFSPPGKMPSTCTAAGFGSSLGKRLVAHSFKGREADINKSCTSLINGADDAWLNQFMDSKPAAQELHLIWRHEPDEENVTQKVWVDAQKKFRQLVDRANTRGRAQYGDGWVNIKFGANLMSWSAQKVPARIANMYPGDGIWEFISWDGYTSIKNGKYETGKEMFQECVDWNKAHGNLPFAIGEFGGDGTAGSDRSGLIKSVCDFAKDNGALWVNYWNTSLGAGKNYILSPSDEKVLGAQSVK